jgi:hypothetical protein
VSNTFRKRLAWQLAVALMICAAEGRAGSPAVARERLVTQANIAVNEGRFADSRSAWLAIWKIERSQVAACNIGALSYRIGDAPAAVRWLSLCKEIMRPPKTVQERKIFESRVFDLAQARQLVGEIRVFAPTGAMITIDGDPVEQGSSSPIPVTPGRHVVRAELNGQTSELAVNVPRSEKRDVKLSIPAAPPRVPAPSKALHVASAGPPPPRPGPRVGVVVGGIAASTVFLALGGGLLAVADEAADDRAATARKAGPNRCFRFVSPVCREAASYEDDMYRAREGAIASLIVGGVLAAATVGYVLLPRRQVEVTASAGGVVVRGAW